MIRIKKSSKIIMGCLFIFSIIVMLIITFITVGQNDTFTQEKWLNNVNNRYTIVNDLLKKNKIIDMGKEEVISLLGKPSDNLPSGFGISIDKRERSPLDIDNTKNCFIYLITNLSMPEKTKALYIKFDQNNVSNYSIISFST